MKYPIALPAAPQWRRSTYSMAEGNDCVEVAAVDRTIAVRDSKHPTGGKLGFTRQQWRTFAKRVNLGQLDI